MAKLEMYRGDDETLDVEIVDFDGSPLNITGGEVLFTAKKSSRQTDDVAVIKKSSVTNGGISITDGPGGVAEVYILPSDTADLYAPTELTWDVAFVDVTGKRRTVASGQLVIKPDVTRRASGYA